MRIHLIAVGGAVMHNLAIALKNNGHQVTGSDDEVYNPSRDRLAKVGLLPKKMGWSADNIDDSLDAVILGMHARKTNPELLKAQELGLPVYSFPEYIYEHSKGKKRLIVAGSHGKTTTTSMIMHVLQFCNKRFDYLVGAQLEGFETMVKLSDAPLIVIEGDEYLSSPIDRRPKFLHYRPHIAIITGIAWDHINVFPTFEGYVNQFSLLLDNIEKEGTVIFYHHDKNLKKVLSKATNQFFAVPYSAIPSKKIGKETTIRSSWGENIPVEFFGQHNMENLQAAFLACQEIGVTKAEFFEAIQTFKGAAKRQQLLKETWTSKIWLDFAHAPSKVSATTKAVKELYLNRDLIACLELHTFSSLNKDFLPNYLETMAAADEAIVYFSEHTLEMKKLPHITKEDIQNAFGHPNLKVFTDNAELENYLLSKSLQKENLIFMTSGNFGGLDLPELAEKISG